MNKIYATFLLGACLLVAVPSFGDVTVGLPADPGTGNCFPYGCAYNAEYQQVYSSTAFSGTISITDLEFYNTQFDSSATSTPSGNYVIDLSTTSAGVGTMSSDFSSNLGGDNTQVFSGSIFQPWAFGDTLTINLSKAFTYNPLDGNLLMTVTGSGISLPGGAIFYDVNSTDGTTTRVYCPSGVACSSGTVDTGYGLVTTFSTGALSTPEPSLTALLGIGLLGLLGTARRRLCS